ncbi:LOW QUALITY PROTEIN: taste receptor type 2 member 7-like [Phascolarctos cinereus]
MISVKTGAVPPHHRDCQLWAEGMDPNSSSASQPSLKQGSHTLWQWSQTEIECVQVTANYFRVSFVTCLNVFYFLKIAHISHPLFLWLKWRINRVVLVVLLGSLVMFLFLSLPLSEGFKDDFIRSIGRKEGKKNTLGFPMRSLQIITVHIFLYLWLLILLIMSLISCFLLILSLWKHTWQMHLNATGSRDPSTEAHIKVIKWVVSFLFFTVLYYLGISITTLTFKVEKRLKEVLGVAIAGCYSSGHSIILILGNNKLRKASLKMMKELKFMSSEDGLKEMV